LTTTIERSLSCRELVEAAGVTEACVVDEKCDRQIRDCVGQAIGAVVRREIYRDHASIDVMLLLEFRGERVQAILAPRSEHYRHALARERPRELEPDTRRRARDERPLAILLTILARIIRHRDFLRFLRGPSRTVRHVSD
jgi:hypothetical protein